MITSSLEVGTALVTLSASVQLLAMFRSPVAPPVHVIVLPPDSGSAIPCGLVSLELSENVLVAATLPVEDLRPVALA